MAVMIPASIADDASPGEQDAFRRLKSSSDTTDWVVLHSLDVARHRRQVAGEIDFLIIVPSLGVLCLEIKACSQLRRDKGAWYYGADPAPDYRGPFKQASDAMHSIRRRVVERSPDLANVVFWSGVLFPNVPFRCQSEEWHDWQVIDDAAYRSRPLPGLLSGILEKARQHLLNCPTARWFQPDSTEPTAGQVKSLTKILRPSFEFFESPNSRLQRLREEVREYTEEQFGAIDAMESNPRVVYAGPAGTGKTLLALECARRAHAEQKRVLFLCFNRLLGNWLADQIQPLRPLVTTKTIHSLMMGVAGATADDPPRRFWQEELPKRATAQLIDHHTQPEYDVLVVDEAQDICRTNYLEFLDLLLKGGLKAGQWRFFGDFEKQAIFHQTDSHPIEVLFSHSGAAPRYELRINCRNRPRLSEFVKLLGGLEPGYNRVLRPDDGVEPVQKYYANGKDQIRLLQETLVEAYGEGFRDNSVVVLSPRKDGECAASAVNESPWADRLKPFHEAGESHTGYCTVHAFKGLERPFIIVTDIEHIRGPAATALFYIAITRGLERLVVLASESARMEVLTILSSRATTP